MPRVRHCVTMRTNTRVQRHCACVNNGLENITLIFTLYLPRNNTFHVGILRPAETTRQRGCANNAQVNNASICRQRNHKWCTVMSLPRRTGEVVAVLFVRGVSATLSYRIVLMVYERLSVISPPPPQQPPSLSSTGPCCRLLCPVGQLPPPIPHLSLWLFLIPLSCSLSLSHPAIKLFPTLTMVFVPR